MPPGLWLAQTVSRPRLLRCLGDQTVRTETLTYDSVGEAAMLHVTPSPSECDVLILNAAGNTLV
jgi:hypothetical protein